MKNTIALIVAASTLGLSGCCTAHHVTKWEYKQIEPSKGTSRVSEDALNKLGDEGWSVVGVGNDNGISVYILKRAKK
jgi:hypothetical protein